ncbi:hypothetical protein DLAC_01105 [Tieghemostelium lacteum]|uniref:Uncharacterized protein n=1 Tax=Tieghemostelium lacteum TaxID=361077 RepID=A0A152A7V0_TIELA|nr:hypothetical protein DLAC_01105 [Tieghemostelium lacteum]|eukprot:KYR02274.1 hypothetical protein DLAC_01105 [Tieghemostelium lacteum]
MSYQYNKRVQSNDNEDTGGYSGYNGGRNKPYVISPNGSGSAGDLTRDIPITPISKKPGSSYREYESPLKKQQQQQQSTPSKPNTNGSSTPIPKSSNKGPSYAFNPQSSISYQQEFEKDANKVINAMNNGVNPKQKQNNYNDTSYVDRSYVNKNPDRFEVDDEDKNEEEDDDQGINETQYTIEDDDYNYQPTTPIPTIRVVQPPNSKQSSAQNGKYGYQSTPAINGNNNILDESKSAYTTSLENQLKILTKSLQQEQAKNKELRNGTTSQLKSTQSHQQRQIHSPPPSQQIQSQDDELSSFYKKRISEMQEQIHREKEVTYEKDSQIIDLEKQNEQLSQTNAKLGKEILSLKKNLTLTQNRFDSEQQTFDEKWKEKDQEMQMEKQNSSNYIEHLLSQIQTLKNDLDLAGDAQSQLNENHQEMLEEKNRLEKMVVKSQDSEKELKDALNNLQRQVSSLTNTNVQKDLKIKQLSEQLNEMHQDMENQRSHSMGQERSINSEIQQFKVELDQVKKHNYDLSQTIKSKNLTVELQEKENNQLKEQINQDRNKHQQEKIQMQFKFDEISNKSKKTIGHYEETIKRIQQDNEQLKIDYNHNDAILKLRSEMKTLQEKNNLLLDSLKQKEQEHMSSITEYQKNYTNLQDLISTSEQQNLHRHNDLRKKLEYAVQDLHLAQNELQKCASPQVLSNVLAKSHINTIEFNIMSSKSTGGSFSSSTTTPQNPLSSSSLDHGTSMGRPQTARRN